MQIGIDEVGRGPIAGPVAVGAFMFKDDKAKRLFRGVKESKQLSESQRESWFEIIKKAKKQGLVDFQVCFQSERIIDKYGISFAIRKCVSSCLIKTGASTRSSSILLDGGLKAPSQFLNQKTIIKGDEKIKVIALASICAKVLRDRRMINLSKKHVEYGFEKHKGYGTAKHYSAIKSLGLLPCHRRSFLRNKKRQ